MKETIVLYPSPGMGHLISVVELGKQFLRLNPKFSITILIPHAPYNTGSTVDYVRHIASSQPSIAFHHLPPVSLPDLGSSSSPHPEALAFRFVRLNNAHLCQALLSISHTATILALIFDFFCSVSIDTVAHLQIPTFFFFTSGASVLAFFLGFPAFHRLSPASFKDLKHTPLSFPGLPPVPASDMPLPLQDRNYEAYHGFLYIAQRLTKCSGIIINTFEELEPRAEKALSKGECVPDGPTPPIYCIGPLIASDGQGEGGVSQCLPWLHAQPKESVVFLCFGSMGLFSEEQLKEIAVGLEQSKVRFLWVVRSPPPSDESQRFSQPPDPDLDSLLPKGFLDRTKDRGMVAKSWVPQVAVLNHGSVGGFVTHCGWNSVLESLSAGVPMVAWPLYAEQRMNKVIMVEELNLAIPIESDKEDGFVGAAEVERRVRELMESEKGKELRKRTLELKEKAVAGMNKGGSSYTNLTELAELIEVKT